jgi:cytidylate kinase
MAVVTITRQYGAGGSLVAQLVAKRLGWTVIDNEFVGEVAQRAGVAPEEVAAREERAPSLMERLAKTLAVSSPEMFVPGETTSEPDEEALIRITERVIAEAAAHGRVVLVGRGATAYLGTAQEAGNAVHAYVVAPRDVRIRTVMARLEAGETEAAKTVDEIDAARGRYLERYYRRRRDDAANYHVVVNTSLLGYEGAADVIVEVATRRGLA